MNDERRAVMKMSQATERASRVKRSRRIGAAVALMSAALIIAAAAGCAATTLEQRTFSQRLNEIQGAQPPLLGYAMAQTLDAFSHTVSSEARADLLEDVAGASGLHPLVAAQLRWRLSRAQAEQGEHEDAAKTLASLGVLTQWRVIGPFPNDNQDALNVAFSPERGAPLAAAVEDGRFPGLRWHALNARDGRLRFATLLSPLDRAGAYAAATIEAPSAQDALLWLAADGAYKVWLNGQPVAARAQDRQDGDILDAAQARVSLKAGQNTLLIKVASAQGGLGLSARLTDANSQPLAWGTALAADATLPPCIDGDAPAVEPVSAQLLAALPPLPTNPTNPDAPRPSLADAQSWSWLAFLLHRADPEDASLTAQRLVLAAAAAYPTDPLIALSAQDVLEDPARKRALIMDALRANPEHPWLLAFRARYLIESQRDDASDELEDVLSRLQRVAPDSMSAEVLIIEHLRNQKHLEFTAYERALDLVARHSTSPAALDLVARLSRDMYDPTLQRAALTDLLAQTVTNEATRAERAALALQQSDPALALSLLDDGLKINPDSALLLLQRAETCDVLGDRACADAAYKTLLDRSPTSSAQWRRYAQWLMSQGDPADLTAATAALQQAQALEPQNATFKQWLRYLDPTAASFEQPFLITDLTPLLDAPDATDTPYSYILDQKITQVHPNGLSSTYTQTVYKVLTPDGAKALQDISVYYTPDQETLEVDLVRVTRPDGSVRSTTFKQSEYHVADERYRMYYDYRNVVLTIPPPEPGDLIEVRHRVSETSASNMFDDHFGDVWYLQSTAARRLARYILLAPASRPFNFRTPEGFGATFTEQTDAAGEQTTYTVSAENIPRVREESSMPGFAEAAAYVHVTTFATWDDVAVWYWNLAKDQWVVDADIHAVVTSLTSGVTDRREVVRRIHNYVVKNTRYVALEFGIHGYKPYKTTLCFRRKFGDCKDKASLIKVMLDDAGVPADIVLIRTRRNGAIDTNPPSMSIFDHAIAYVPEFDLYLDGTAEFSGTDELPSQDQGTLNLIVHGEGDYTLRQSPVFPPETNTLTRAYAITLNDPTAAATDAAGDKLAGLHGDVRAVGQFAPDYRRRFETENDAERTRRFEDDLTGEFPSASLKQVKFSDITQLEAPVTYAFDAQIPSPLRADASGGFSLYPLSYRPNLSARMASTTTRDHDLVLSFPFTLDHDITYTLPPTLAPATLPAPTDLTTPYGSLRLTVTQPKPNEVRVQSHFVLTPMQVPASEYPAYRDFILAADRALDTPIPFKKR
jgi:cellulose synthase operon protein C